MQHGSTHKLIMPVFSDVHWLLREAKAAAWVNLSLDLLHSARGVCSAEWGIINNYFQSDFCAVVQHKFSYQQSITLPLFFKQKRMCLEITHGKIITSINHVVVFPLSGKDRKVRLSSNLHSWLFLSQYIYFPQELSFTSSSVSWGQSWKVLLSKWDYHLNKSRSK